MRSWQIEEFRKSVIKFDSFIKDLSGWLNEGQPSINRYKFSSGKGLCYLHQVYCETYLGLDLCTIRRMKSDMYHNVYPILGQFYPFNNNDGDEYEWEFDNNTVFENTERLDFIRKAMEVING